MSWPAKQADIRWIKRCTAVLQFEDVVSFEIGRMLAAGLAVLAPFKLELGDQAAPSPAVVDRPTGFRLWPGGSGVDGFQARPKDL
jgi:hypothetical protein